MHLAYVLVIASIKSYMTLFRITIVFSNIDLYAELYSYFIIIVNYYIILKDPIDFHKSLYLIR